MPEDKVLEDRRKAKLVLKELREHQTQVEDDKEEATDCRSDALAVHLEQATQNEVKSTTVDQALVDAQIFRRLAEYTGRQAEQLQSGLRTYDVKSFVDCLLSSMCKDDNGEEGSKEIIDIVKLGRSVARNYRTVPCLDFMYGNDPKDDGERKPRERRAVTRQAVKGKDAVRPNELRSDQVEQTETDRQVAMMKRELEKQRRCNFWTFVIDPNDFARSVENLFHSSFLIKDGWAQLDLNVTPPSFKYREADPVNETGSGPGAADRSDCSEFIMEFDSMVWKDMIQKYQIRRAVFPRDRVS